MDYGLTKILFNKTNETFKFSSKKQNQYWRVKNNIYHHDFLPNINVIEDNGKFGKYNFITNSMGFKDKDTRKINLNKTKHRIIFIGDSFTEGLFLPYEKTFVGIIDQSLSSRNIEILNAGVSSYSPIIYYKKIQSLIENNFEFDELIVFIDISDIEDEAIVYRLSDSKIITLDNKEDKIKKEISYSYINFLKKNLFVSYSVLNFIHDKTIPTLNKSQITEDEFINFMISNKHTRDKWTINDEIRIKYNDGIKNSLKYMNLLSELCKKNNIELSIAVYPWISQIYYDDINSLQVDMWKKFSIERGLAFYNFFPDLINYDKNLSKLDIIKKLTIQFDAHFNSEGNKVIAQGFLDRYSGTNK